MKENQKTGQPKGLIFDFDGTLADTFVPILDIVNQISTEMGFTGFPRNFREAEIRERSTLQVLRQAGVPRLRIPDVVKRVRRELSAKIEGVAPISGIVPVLRKLKRSGVRMGILTSNSRANVEAFLRQNEIFFFDFIYCGSSLFGKHIVLKKLLRELSHAPCDYTYVGDETRDIEAARKIRMPVAAVSWGFNSANLLRQHRPDHLMNMPEQLLEFGR